MRALSRLGLSLLFTIAIGACDNASDKGAPASSGAPTSTPTSSAARAPSGSASAVAATSASAAAPSASASAAPDKAATIVESYKGSFDAKRKKVKLPSGVTEPMWGTDKGKAATGKGTIELSVWSDGRVTGAITGPLGDLDVEGSSDSGVLTATLKPKDPGGFRGTLGGKLEGGKFTGKLDASSRDTTTVREADLALDKSK